MTPLRKRMLDELQLRILSTNTVERYISIVQQFARHFGKSPEKLGAEHVREYLLYLMREKKAANTVLLCRAPLRFLYLCTLKQTWFNASIPHPDGSQFPSNDDLTILFV